MSTPRSFYGAEVCPGAPMPASRPPGTLGICHTCDHFCTVRKPTIQPDVFTHRTGPSAGTVDCTNWVPVGHVRTVSPIADKGNPHNVACDSGQQRGSGVSK